MAIRFSWGTVLKSFCTIDDDTVIREFVTIHRATGEGSTTSIGNHRLPEVVDPSAPDAVFNVDDGHVYGSNAIGLMRAGIDTDGRRAIKNAVRVFFFSKKSKGEARNQIAETFGDAPEVKHFLEFTAESHRGFIAGTRKRPVKNGATDDL